MPFAKPFDGMHRGMGSNVAGVALEADVERLKLFAQISNQCRHIALLAIGCEESEFAFQDI